MSILKSFDQTTIHYEIDEAEDTKAIAVIVHGFGDHCGRYTQFAQLLNTWSITCYRFDYRGHGRSEGKRGHCMQFSDYLQDVNCVIQQVQHDYPHHKKFLLAHSHGGLVALHSLAQNQSFWQAAVLSSPFFGIELEVPMWKRFAGNALSKIMPTFQMPTDVDPSWVSHDEAVVQGYAEDPLIGRVATARWFTEAIQAHQQAPQAASQVHIPLLLQAAGTDYLVSLDATRKVFDSLASADQQMIVYDDLLHEIWFEKDKQQVLQDLQSFLTRFIE